MQEYLNSKKGSFMPEDNITYDVLHEAEDVILKVDYDKATTNPSVEDDPLCMSKTFDMLMEAKNATKIVFYQKRDFEYDFEQTQILKEIALLQNNLVKRKDLTGYGSFDFNNAVKRMQDKWFTFVQELIVKTLKSDPLAAYVELRREIRRKKVELVKEIDENKKLGVQKYVQRLMTILNALDATKLIQLSKPHLEGYKTGERDLYRTIFKPVIRPDFMYTKLMASYPQDAEEIDSYSLKGGTEVVIFRLNNSVQTLYHITPPEFKLSEDKYELLDTARNVLAEHKPKREEFINPQRMRDIFYNVGKDLLQELAQYRNITLKDKEVEELTQILIRYTIGFGLVEVLLSDEAIQDISVNSPFGHSPIFIVHGKYDDCITNIIPMRTEAESWASKLRLISGRPLDEANPILDTELEMPGASVRISTITFPLDPTGIAFSFRRHRDKPWTLPLFMKYKMIDPLAAGLISFLIDGNAAMLVAGTRSSGKSSFLGSCLVEIMRRYRMITIEDTLELPAKSLRELGFNIQQLKVAGALAMNTSEVSASDGIRSTLRLGDSALIIGEVRSKEAISLYEAMRVGAAANVVAGTIHADSPYGIFDRVVNDIGVPKTSFKATDICIIASPIKSADGLHKHRRVTQVTEVRKFWNDDPLKEGGFVDLMKYNAETDMLEPTDDLLNGNSDVLKRIASKIPDFVGDWDAIWKNIELRSRFKKAIVDYAKEYKDQDALEAKFVIECNDQFHLVSDYVKSTTSKLDPEMIWTQWNNWFQRAIKLRQMNRRKDER
jgi:archaeal flagellar protein FlaI